MIGIELVSGKDTRQPFTDVAPWLNGDLSRFVRRKHGILLGVRSSALLITPPLIVTAIDATRICNAIIDAVHKIDHSDFRLPDV